MVQGKVSRRPVTFNITSLVPCPFTIVPCLLYRSRTHHLQPLPTTMWQLWLCAEHSAEYGYEYCSNKIKAQLLLNSRRSLTNEVFGWYSSMANLLCRPPSSLWRAEITGPWYRTQYDSDIALCSIFDIFRKTIWSTLLAVSLIHSTESFWNISN